MNESVVIGKEADAKKGFSSARRNNKSIQRVRDESERQLDSLGGVIGNIRRDGATPSAESIATQMSGIHTAERAPALLALQKTHGNRYVQRVVAGIQAKLTVGQPGDIYEQEADRVADAVMRMPEPQVQRQVEPEEEEEEEIQTKPLAEEITQRVQRQVEEEEEEELIQTKALSEQIMPLVQRQEAEEEEEEIQTKPLSSQTSEVVSDVETSIRGGGQPLPGSTRAFFEPRFGQDFSQVRLHTDARAADVARAVNAKAFTMGRNVVFGAGQYAPGTQEGRRLMAHELVHVVQQNGSILQHQAGLVQPIQAERGAFIAIKPLQTNQTLLHRKITVDGKAYTPAQKYYNWLKKNYSKVMVEFIEGMHNSGNPPEYKFDSYEQMGYEVRVRHNAIRGMKEVHNGCCNYPTGSGTGSLNSTYWDKKGPFQFTMKSPLPSGKKPSDAIESIFKSGAGTLLECNSTMVAIQYYAMLKALGKTKFNTKFPGGTGIIISPHHQPPTGVVQHPIWKKKLYKRITISGASDLLPGDWVYFKNISDYIIKHPGGPFSGEHALYLGDGKFRGFGVPELTELDLKTKLLKEYNDGLPLSDKKFIGDVPGLQNYARRPVIKEITK